MTPQSLTDYWSTMTFYGVTALLGVSKEVSQHQHHTRRRCPIKQQKRQLIWHEDIPYHPTCQFVLSHDHKIHGFDYNSLYLVEKMVVYATYNAQGVKFCSSNDQVEGLLTIFSPTIPNTPALPSIHTSGARISSEDGRDHFDSGGEQVLHLYKKSLFPPKTPQKCS